MKYEEMMSHLDLKPGEEVSDAEAEAALLRRILRTLHPDLKKRIARELEADRVAFARSSTPGHLSWYPQKVAICAAFERLTL